MSEIQIVMYVGFLLAAYSVVGNDVIQTLGTFLTSNEKRPWWILALFAGTVLSLVLSSLKEKYKLRFEGYEESNMELINYLNSESFNDEFFFQKIGKAETPYHNANIVYNKNLLISSLQGLKNRNGYFFFDTRQSEIIGSGKIFNDIDNGPNQFTFICSYDNYVIALLYPSIVYDWWDKKFCTYR